MAAIWVSKTGDGIFIEVPENLDVLPTGVKYFCDVRIAHQSEE